MESSCLFCQAIFKKKYKAQIYCSLRCSNRANLNGKNNDVVLPRRYSSDLAEFVGILLGDGTVSTYFVKVYLNMIADKDYAKYVLRLSKKLFPKAAVTNRIDVKRGTTDIQISAKVVCDYLKRIGFKPKRKVVPRWIKNQKRFIKATLRGLFDTEGTIGFKYFDGKNGNYFYKQLTFTNSNNKLLRFVEKQLEKLGYKPTKDSIKNIYLSNRKDVERYFKEIGSSNQKMIRKNHLERIGKYQYGGIGQLVAHRS